MEKERGRAEWRSWNDVCIAAADREGWRQDIEALHCMWRLALRGKVKAVVFAPKPSIDKLLNYKFDILRLLYKMLRCVNSSKGKT